MRLNDIQERFHDHMLRAAPDIDADFAGLFAASETDLPERLRIYRDNIMLGLLGVLNEHYPAVRALVGDAFMDQMGRDFIRQNPPQEGCLSFYGAEFPAFIAGFAPAAGLAYLPDVARLERALLNAEQASDDDALQPEELGGLNTDGEIYLPLRACVSLLRSSYPVAAIRDYALDPDRHALPDIHSGGTCLLVTRRLFKGEAHVIEEADNHLLAALAARQPLGEALEITLQHFPEFDFAGFLQTCMGRGIFKSRVRQ